MTSEEYRAIRLQLGLSQSELGKLVGMRASDISRIERGQGGYSPTKQQTAAILLVQEVLALRREIQADRPPQTPR